MISLSENGNTLAAGAAGGDGPYNNATETGEVVIYQYDAFSQTWKLRGEPIYGGSSNEFFGLSLSLSDTGHIVVIGGPVAGLGHVRVYDNEPSAAPSLAPTTVQPTFSPIRNPISTLAPVSLADTGSTTNGGGCCATIRKGLERIRDQAANFLNGMFRV